MITKKQVKDYLKRKLGNNVAWAIRALHVIHGNQTLDERTDHATRWENGIGFSGFDAPFLTSLANQIDRGRRLSPKQTKALLRTMPKYWKQIVNHAGGYEKFHARIEAEDAG